MKKSAFAAATLSLGLITAGSAGATDLYSNFGPGMSYDTSSAAIVSPAFSSNPLAFEFTNTTSGDLAQMDIALYGLFGTGTTVVSLFSAVGDTLGAALGSWSVPSLPSSSGTPVTISGITGVTLTAGQNYFIQVDASDGPATAWNYNNIGAMGAYIQNGVTQADTATLGAFDLVGADAVPEASTWSLMLLGFGGLGAVIRRRRAGVVPSAA